MSPLNYQVQIEFVWQELASDYYSSMYLALKISTSIEEAVSIIDFSYEVPQDPSQSHRQRLINAQNIFAEMKAVQCSQAIVQCD